MKLVRYSCLLLLIAAAAPLFGQQDERPSGGAIGEAIQVNLVEIPVNVFDREGKAVRGLKPENFEVYDDGKRRRITHFEEIDVATIATAPLQTFNPAARRSFMIIFDLSNTSQRGIERAKVAARQFVSSALKPRDLLSVSAFSVEAGIHIVTSFTTDRALLDDAIRNIGRMRFVQSRDPLLLASIPDIGMVQNAPPEDLRGLELEQRQLDRLVQQQINAADDRYKRTRVEKQLRTFGELAKMLDRIHGRKQIVLLSEGFDSRLVQGREIARTTDEEAIALFRGEIWKFDGEDRFGSPSAMAELNEMAKLFRRSDVILHAIDVKGLRTSADPRAGSQRQEPTSESLYLLADGTGGQLFKNENALDASFARMLKQQEVIYILGFQTQPSGNPGKFHDLKVKVKVVGFAGLQVAHRAGYYEPQLQMSAVEQILSATDILMNDIPFEDVRSSLLVVPFPRRDGNASVPVILEIDGESLLEMVKGNSLHGEIFVYAFDHQNSVKDYLFQTVTLDLTQIREALRRTGLKYYATLSLPAGEFTIKSLVRVVESGMNGFSRVRLEVPRYGDPAILPPLFQEEPGKWIMLKGASKAGGEPIYPFFVGSESFIPSAQPRLSAMGRYKLALFTHNLPADELQLSVILRDPRGTSRNAKLRLIGRTTADEHGVMKLLLEFEPTELPAGDYLLDVSVRQEAAPEVRTVTAPLRIEPPASGTR